MNLREENGQDKRKYKKGIKISNKEFNNINMKKHKINPEWNYSIYPQNLSV
jgi:hypothetical protein